ncbi:polysaccharide deacetylase [Metarhizobium album]|uniref:Polysaccharide deacetylase n=1 Tax=Metarhizobium album TaxID=2182425 RepID=A0A2U2DW84_9HYPH|nr:polysaccharide deacetylase [Rhizobium album]PWE57570.1 polysaccharide deacetylase [Rhizobium album]
MFRSLFLSALAFSLPSAGAFAETPKQQLLLISFDGAHDNALWQKSRDMAKRTGARFTYFLSCTFLMNADARKAYQAPGHKKGRSNVGFAQSGEEIRTRLDHIWNAHLEGHDIGSHACGHFDGKDWTKTEWTAEFRTFRQTLAAVWQGIGLKAEEPAAWQDFVTHGIVGFRAPYLSTSKALTDAETADGFLYDASLVTKGPRPPAEQDGLVRFGLPLIPEGPQQRPVIGMDYNLFVRHSVGIENPSRSQEFEERTYAAFKAAFDKQYDGERIPLQLGFHFVEMNGGAYWRALDRLLSDVCHRSDVACVTYPEAIRRMKQDENGKVAGSQSAF